MWYFLPKNENFAKKIRKRFAEKEKVRIFAPRLRERHTLRSFSKARRSLTILRENKEVKKKEKKISLKIKIRVFSSCDEGLQFQIFSE